MLDIHTHILPMMDDGSRNPKQSKSMLRREAKQGVDRLVLTPHFYADKESPDKFIKRRSNSLAMLESEITDQNALPQWYLGAEVSFFIGMSRIEDIEKLCIENTNAMLIEMPFDRWGRNILDELDFLIENRGIRPIIAHIERYMRYQPLGTVRRLCERGIWIQANAAFFASWQTSWLAMRMLKSGRIQFIGSDCHDTKERKPNIGTAISLIEKKIGNRAIEYIAYMEKQLLDEAR